MRVLLRNRKFCKLLDQFVRWQILNISSELCVGFASKYSGLDQLPGTGDLPYPSVGYHSRSGNRSIAGGPEDEYSEPYGLGDTVGCGVDFKERSIFYTKNGTHLGKVHHYANSELLTICVHCRHCR